MRNNMAIKATPLHPTLGAELRGVDLTRPVAPEVFAEVEAAFNRCGILVFPDQPVTDEQQLAFSRLFGPLEVNQITPAQDCACAPTSPTSPTWTPKDGCSRATTGATCSTSATNSGTPTARSNTFRRNARCSRPANCPHQAARPNSPICGP